MNKFYCHSLKISKDNRIYVDINFSIAKSLALVGESGSGKSLTLKALLQMLPKGFKVQMKTESDFKLERGKTLGYVPQNPFTALSPLTKIKDQWIISQDLAPQMMEQVGLESKLLNRFPPELSGGQLQRVVIAMALSTNPKLLLLDEPTTALDADLREVIIKLLLKLQEKLKFKMLFVTHDISTASKLCSEITVIKKGRVVETGLIDEVLRLPKKEYTKALIEAGFANREFRK